MNNTLRFLTTVSIATLASPLWADTLDDLADNIPDLPAPSVETQAAEAAESPLAMAFLEASAEKEPEPKVEALTVITVSEPTTAEDAVTVVTETATVEARLENTPASPWEAEFAGGIAAVVKINPDEKDKDNDGTCIITVEEVRREMAPLIPQVKRDSTDMASFQANIDLLSRQVLQNIIDRYLILQDARVLGVKVPDAYLKNFFDGQLADQFQGNRTIYQEYLQATGKTDRSFKKEMEEQLVVDYMRSIKRKSQSEVSPQKLEAYYKANQARFFREPAVHLRQIMLLPGNEVQATAILEKLAAGEAFEKLASIYSQDDKRTQGGDWGWINHSDIRQELSSVAFALPEKSYSTTPVNLGGTLFILYVENKREGGIAPLKDVRLQIEGILANELAMEAQEKWLKALRKEASIRYML